MSIQLINQDDVETFTLTTNPPRTYSSGSVSGVSGTLYVFSRRSPVEKDVFPMSMFSASYTDQNLDTIRTAIVQNTGSNKLGLLQTYFKNVTSQSVSLRKQQTVEVVRFQPPPDFTDDTLRKGVVVNHLMPFYRGAYPESHFAFTNHHTLNFMTGANLPEDAAIIYPDASQSYSLSGAFSFDFWINPRYTSDYPGVDFKAGTIFHRSSSYAVSLVTGSSKDVNNQPNAFKLVLQLSHSAEIEPSKAHTGNKPYDLVFFSNDNVLQRNTWHHVSIRWGTTGYNNGSGSFLVDGNTVGTFVIPSASLVEHHQENCLFVGNFFEGQAVGYFFTTEVAQRDGLEQLVADTGQWPSGYLLDHGLNAEVHDLKIYGRYLNNTEITTLQTRGPSSGSSLLQDGLLFYLPPFYTTESPYRKFYGDHGGVLVTPFEERDGTTAAPYNVEAAFGGYGHYLNLENFVRDFATSQYGRLFNLTASAISTTSQVPESFNEFLYDTGSNLKRNMMLLPNDNGNFLPDFTFMIPDVDDYNILSAGFVPSVTQSFQAPWKVDPSQFINDLGSQSPGFITLRNMLPMSAFQLPAQADSSSLGTALNGVSPESLGDLPSDSGRYTILQRTGDNSSNQVVFFDISNLYYGIQIEPGTLVIRDTNTTGSRGKMEMTLKDDGEGNVFRANHSGSVPDWSSAGNVFYNEGIVILKHPSLYFFGADQFEVSFQGKQNTHILTFNLFKRAQMVTSSSNPNYLPVSASTNANDTDKRFVFLTGINLHDENLNVITRTSFAQPVVARTAERFLFKVKLDY